MTRSPLGVVKSGRHAPGIVRVVVVGAAVGVDKAEIVRVARIDGTAPDIGRRQRVRRPATRHVIRDTPKNDLFSFSVAFYDRPDQFIFPVDLFPQALRHVVQFLGGLRRRYAFPVRLCKHPCGFNARMV